MSKVFIGMPIYNSERFLREAIDSIVGQIYRDWTLYISDNASTDRTAEICAEYVRRDSRIVYYRQQNNLGPFPNFKFTLDAAKGKFFMWAAGDDLWDKDFIKVCMEHFEKDPSLGLVTTCNTSIDSFGRPLMESPWMTRLTGRPGWINLSKQVMQAESYGKCNLMYGLFRLEAMRETWKAYPQRSVWGQDYMFSLAATSRFGVAVDARSLFKKRLGGFSSPQLNLTEASQTVEKVDMSNAKNQMFPFGRFGIYFSGHREALRGTRYWPLAYLLFLRLPRALVIHIRERSFKSFFQRQLKKMGI